MTVGRFCAPLEVGELLPDCYSYQKLLRVSSTAQVSGSLLYGLVKPQAQSRSRFNNEPRARIENQHTQLDNFRKTDYQEKIYVINL